MVPRVAFPHSSPRTHAPDFMLPHSPLFRVHLLVFPALLALVHPAEALITGIGYTFTGTQASPTDPAVLASIQIGTVTYSDLIAPEAYENIDLNGTTEIRENTADVGVGPADPSWDPTALEAFESRNLNHYQQLDDGNLGATWRLSYAGSGISQAADLFLVVTERNANNTFQIESFDVNGSSLGILLVEVTDYSPTGAQSLSTDLSKTEDITAAVYPISSLVQSPSGNNIQYIEITNNFTTSDGGDGKVFFFGDGATNVPEPSAVLLVGLAGAAGLFRRRR